MGPSTWKIGMQRVSTAGAFALASTLVSTGCVRQLPPRPAPDVVVPSTNTTSEPDPGKGRLVIDVVDGPTPIQRVHMNAAPFEDDQGRTRFRFHEAPEPLCATSPCVVDLTPGNLLLGFPVAGDDHALDVELVHIGEETAVYRRSLSHYRHNRGALWVLGIVGTSLGGTSFLTGTTLLPLGLSDGNDGLTLAGATTLGAGALLITFGVLAIRADSSTYRSGSAIHFPLAPPAGP
jgi:hypothetical protein